MTIISTGWEKASHSENDEILSYLPAHLQNLDLQNPFISANGLSKLPESITSLKCTLE